MSVFLQIPAERHVASNALAFAVRDAFPVTEGHTLIITRRVVPTWFDATPQEHSAVLALVETVKQQLDAELAPDGYNVGFNAGEAAGQTVPHLHVHVIPRYRGDLDDPRGGVRHVIPARGNYRAVEADWTRPPGPSAPPDSRAEPLSVGGAASPLLRPLRSLFGRAERVSIVAAFVQDSGLALLAPAFEDVLARGAAVRLVTGDYLHITQADALQRLLDLQDRSGAFATVEDGAEERAMAGRFEARVVETQALRRSFHPKAWLFGWGDDPRGGVAYVGSSNISNAALRTGVEWNLRLEQPRDPAAFTRLEQAFDALWQTARPLDAAWVTDYRARASNAPSVAPLGEVELDSGLPPTPRDVQREALDELSNARSRGDRRALVVLATGLGKTFLAAFDLQAFAEQLGRRPRALFVAHRRELLTQAETTFRTLFPDWRFTWCAGASDDLDGDVVFASIQKLGRPERLSGLAPGAFDYVVIDEVHHAAALSYQRLLARLDPAFLLGLTATPDRADEADVVGLFDDHVPYRMGLAEGIARGLLVPFAYEGLRDTVDYAPIPWRNRRFDPAALAAAVQTQARMESLWAAWQRLPGTRTLIFCASIEHARFVRDWLAARQVRVEAVHSQDDSFDRAEGLRRLEEGDLDALCAVDLFNEGIDCKPIDRVVMLRPTESPVVFLQQLGRGLRITEDKARLQVIDFVGNHRVFLDRLRTLLSLGDQPASTQAFLRGEAQPTLPPGCSIEVALEAKALLQRLLPASSDNELVRLYRELRAARDQRPTAGELHRMGRNPASVRTRHGSWLAFVADEGDLDPAERSAFERSEAWLTSLERTAMSKCFKMVVLEVLVEADALATGMPLDLLARRCHAWLARSPELLADLDGVKALDDRLEPDPQQWLSYWTRNPIAAWTTPNKQSRAWFELEADALRPRLPFVGESEADAALVALTRELVDWRLSEYRRRRRSAAEAHATGQASAFTMRVLQRSGGDPVLHFGNQKDRDRLPTGETDVRLPDGSIWQFRFAKIACNVARPVGADRSGLQDLLRRWFGPAAGQRGATHEVRFHRAPEGWWAEPVALAEVLAFPRGYVTAYPTLRAAAGQIPDLRATQGEAVEGTPVRLPLRRPDAPWFAVRATGDSMDGGDHPIRDGDWVLLEWARNLGPAAVAGRVALVALGEGDEGHSFLLKRIVRRTDGTFALRSDNRRYPERPISEHAQVIALKREVLQPETLAPAPGTRLDDDALADAFGLESAPFPPRCRIDGHLFLLVDAPRSLTAPDRLHAPPGDRHPGETAYVLTRTANDQPWRYAGVGRWLDTESRWAIPEVDFQTWRALGSGRGASRRIEERWLNSAQELAERLATEGGWHEARGARCRVVGRAPKGGLRIDGGPGGFAERTVSILDLAWVLAARDQARRDGAPVDEARVNRLRYLDGTPKDSTRWIDTGWALVLTDQSK